MKSRATPTVLFPLLAMLAACGDTTPPILQEVAITSAPNMSAPLVAAVHVRTDEPVVLRFRVEAGGARWDVEPGTELSSDHRLALLGLRAGTDHRIVVLASDAAHFYENYETRNPNQRRC